MVNNLCQLRRNTIHFICESVAIKNILRFLKIHKSPLNLRKFLTLPKIIHSWAPFAASFIRTTPKPGNPSSAECWMLCRIGIRMPLPGPAMNISLWDPIRSLPNQYQKRSNQSIIIGLLHISTQTLILIIISTH